MKTRPLPGEPKLGILKAMPSASRVMPAPFIAGSRHQLETLSKKMVSTYEDIRPAVADEWTHWTDHLAPQTDDSADYVANQGCGVVPGQCQQP